MHSSERTRNIYCKSNSAIACAKKNLTCGAARSRVHVAQAADAPLHKTHPKITGEDALLYPLELRPTSRSILFLILSTFTMLFRL